MTIRRDVETMEKQGLVLRTHGGCILRSAFVSESTFPEKESLNQIQKQAIAREAVSTLRSGFRIYLDTGTTCLHIARCLPSSLDLTVFTNNLRVATETLGRPGISVHVYGGQLAGKNPDLTGDYAIVQISSYPLDLAFLGADALDLDSGKFYGAEMATALMAQAVSRQAQRTIAVIDSSKFNKRSVAVAGRLQPGLTLITDRTTPPSVHKKLRNTGAAIILAQPASP